jgi:hypothetical protein
MRTIIVDITPPRATTPTRLLLSVDGCSADECETALDNVCSACVVIGTTYATGSRIDTSTEHAERLFLSDSSDANAVATASARFASSDDVDAVALASALMFIDFGACQSVATRTYPLSYGDVIAFGVREVDTPLPTLSLRGVYEYVRTAPNFDPLAAARANFAREYEGDELQEVLAIHGLA